MAVGEEEKVNNPIQIIRTGYRRGLRTIRRAHRRAKSARLSNEKPSRHELKAEVENLWDLENHEQLLFSESLDDRLIKAIINDEVQNVKMLIEKKADPNAVDDVEGFSALMWATHRVHVNCVRVLVQCKCNVSATTDWGWSALMDAAQQGNQKVLSILLEAKAMVNQRETHYGRTALLEAAYVDNQTNLTQLLDAGAAPAIDFDGNTALHHAAMSGCLLNTQILVEYIGLFVMNRRKVVTGILIHFHRRLPLSVAELISMMAIPPCDLRQRNLEGKLADDLALENFNDDIVLYLRSFVTKGRVLQAIIV